MKTHILLFTSFLACFANLVSAAKLYNDGPYLIDGDKALMEYQINNNQLKISDYKGDLSIPKTFKINDIEKGSYIFEAKNIIKSNNDIDFFFINSFNLDSKVIFEFPQPFDTNNLPKTMERYSNKKKSHKLKFFDLINFWHFNTASPVPSGLF